MSGVRLRPSRSVTVRWSLVGVGAGVAAAWGVVDSDGHGLAWALLVAVVVVAAPVVAQLLLPGRFSWWLDGDGLVARTPLRVLRLGWEEIHLARVVTQLGEPALELHVEHHGRRTTSLVLLPLGADLAALHRALAQHLGAPGALAAGGAADVLPPDGGADPRGT